MRNSVVKSTREEIRQKLISLYSDSLESNREVLDFDRKYDLFSTDESLVLKFSSNWFRPEKYSCQLPWINALKGCQNICSEDGKNQRAIVPQHKRESILRIERPTALNSSAKDLEVLGKTPYQIGVDGEKFRVVAATLQKCNSPFVRRTFHFTSDGIVEATERKDENELMSVIPMLKQTKTGVPQKKFVRIRRFRVVKKDDLSGEKYILPQKIKVTNGERTRFLTVRIRSKNSNMIGGENYSQTLKLEPRLEEFPRMITTPLKIEPEPSSTITSSVQTEEVEEVEQTNPSTSETETSSLSLDPTEEEIDDKMDDAGGHLKEDEREVVEIAKKIEGGTETGGELFNCENCGKQFSTYLSCLAHFRSHQRQACQICEKKFLTARLLRDHLKLHHHERTGSVPKTGTSEDRIMTATSKFGRTRQVLNVAGLRSKYKML